jgi:hypothetical protein
MAVRVLWAISSYLMQYRPLRILKIYNTVLQIHLGYAIPAYIPTNICYRIVAIV